MQSNPPEDNGRIDELNERLYSRTKYADPKDSRSPIEATEESEVKETWESPDLDDMLRAERKPENRNTFMKKIFILAVVFFAAALAVTSYVIFGGANFVSSKNVDVSVEGPVAVSAGEALELAITVTNRNNADLEGTNLSIQYPSGSRNPDDTSRSLTYERFELGKVKPGEEALQNAKVVVFGERGEVKELKIRVEYRIKGSNATFFREKLYAITIGDAPVTVTVDMPSSVTSGENFTTTVELTSNSKEILQNIMLRAEYPYGYSVDSSSPTPSGDDNLWALGAFSPGDKKTITIQGKITGENEEERTFRFYVGVGEEDSGQSFKTPIATLNETVLISRPSVGLALEFAGESGSTYVAPAGRSISANVRFQNNLSEKLLNPTIEVRLSGAALDKFSIIPSGGGFYDSANSRIVWNLASGGEQALLPGDRGSLGFSFASLASLPAGTREEIQLKATITGLASEGGDTNRITVSESKTVRISSQVTLSSKSQYSVGAFKNKGPIPPKAEQETTYTIVFSAGNTRNDIQDTKVTAKLGQNVKWLMSSNIAAENISYDANTNTITWDVGTLASGAGFSAPGREVSFQVGLTPSLGQLGTTPLLVNNIALTGVDSFTSTPVTVTNTSVTTRTTGDPSFVQGNEVVVK